MPRVEPYFLGKNLIGYWDFNNTNGIIAPDSSRFKNNGTIFGATKLASSRGLNFDGVDDYVNIGINKTLNDVVTGNFTIEAWIKPNSTVLKAIVGKLQFNPDSWGLYQTSQKFFMQYRGTGAGADPSSNSIYTIGNWYYVVGTRTNTTNRLYVNGILQSSQGESSQTPETSGIKFVIGSRSGVDYYFQGTINEVRIWNRALSTNEIFAEYNRNKGKYI